MDIICFPDMAWDYVLWTNRQHVMSRLPKMYSDVRVLYVSPPRLALSQWLGPSRRSADASRHQARNPAGRWMSLQDERLWMLQPMLPAPNRLVQRYAAGAFDRWLLWSVRQAVQRLRFSRPIVWTYTPFAEHFLGQLGERLVCYDVVDDYPALPHYQRLRPGVAEADDRLLRRADLVFFASEKLYEARRDRNPHSHLLGNAADIELFASAQTSSPPRPSDLTDIKDPIVAFHGAITSYKLDLALIRDLVLKRPDWSFVFIGPVLDETSSTALRDLPNLYLLGSKAQHELPAYLAHASVSIIPYQQNPYTEGINALKLYECLATGNPVVATDLPCFQGFGDMVLLAVGVDSFVEAINRALTDQRDELRAARLAAARPYSWDRKIERMMGFIVARLDSAS